MLLFYKAFIARTLKKDYKRMFMLLIYKGNTVRIL